MQFRTLLLLLLLDAGLATTGKISGVVRDGETGNPLPGVNVIVEATDLGAATDVNGEYVILNLPPGEYSVTASFIGYATLRVTGIRINTGQTSIQNFSLSQEAVAGEEVEVVAQRPLVEKDLTASRRVTTAEDIDAMPVESFIGVLTTQAGVNVGAGGELHIRGGRSNEVGFYIDGVSVSNPFFTNSLAINVSNKALEEMKVVSGAFNAEYGNAMSGIVNLQIKEGGDRYSGSFSADFGDYQSVDSEIYPNLQDWTASNRRVIEATLNGPVPLLSKLGKITFNISGRYNSNSGYLQGIREHTVGDSANFETPSDWYIEMGGDSAYVPMNTSEGLNFVGKLTYKVTPRLKLSAQLLHSGGESQSYSHHYRFNPDGRSTYESGNNNFSVKLNHALGKRSFYEAHAFVSSTDFAGFQFKRIDLSEAVKSSEAVANEYLIYTVTSEGLTEYTLQNSNYVPTTRIKGSPTSATFSFGGSQRGHSYRKSNSRGFKFDFTSQVTTRHEMKTGVSFREDDLDERNFTVLYDNQRYRVPTILPENDSPSHNYYTSKAQFFSAYLQDKLEYQNFVMNLGVRYDAFNPNSEHIAALLDPEGEKSASARKSMISPRLGIALPITDRGILHFSYGHFYQMPTLRSLYRQSIFGAGLAPSIGYSDLKPERTVLYEFGLQQQLTHVIAVDASVFYKDIRELLALQSIYYESSRYGPSNYAIYLNKDYGAVKGLTLSLEKRYDSTTKTSAFLDYTYQVGEGNALRSGSFFFNALTGKEEEKNIVPLSWDQRHILNATVTISNPRSWGVSFIGKVATGWPYTPNIPFANYVPDPNTGRKPIQRTVDMRFYKKLNLRPFVYILSLKVYNLFDARNERYVFNDTGRSGYTFVNRTTQETAAFKQHYGEPGIHEWSEYQIRPHYYTAPRLVSLGFSLEL